ncbi:MAG TPA: hypothetical protein VJR71_05535 [Pseudolabrys sp.]|nr:hypothetical protein [Pseudolabrys sp.]
MNIVFATAAKCGRLAPVLAFILAAGAGPSALAQTNSLFSAMPSTGLISPLPSTRTDIFGPSSLPTSPSNPKAATPNVETPTASIPVAPPVPSGQVALVLNARFGKDAPQIGGGLIWRVYNARPDGNGNFKLVKEEKSPAPTVVLPAGNYIVHVGFGLASAVRPVDLRGPAVHEQFDLPAGGLRIEGKVGDVRIPPGQISFDVYKGSQFEAGDRRPIAEHIMTSDVLVVPEGTYYIVSNYGDANSVVRSDIRVQSGKLTDITVTHRAAAITLKLVTDRGSEALANTAWSVLTPGGDVIKESIGAFPRVILAEGEYRAIARNEGKVYEREFKVVTGVDGDVEVLAR